jgi:hypothetical protein
MGEQLGNFCLGALATVPHAPRLSLELAWNELMVFKSGGTYRSLGWAMATPQSRSTLGAKTKPFNFYPLAIIFPTG